MNYDILMLATGVVFSVFVLVTIIAWWAWLTVEKIDDRSLSMVAFFTPIIPILIGVTYFVLVN